MKTRSFLLVFGLAAAAAFAQTVENNWTPPKTAWGDPDLQGVYTTDDLQGVPLQRPKEFGTRRFLTEEEYAARSKEVKSERSTIDTGIRPTTGFWARVHGVDAAAAPAQWIEYARHASHLTSLIVDPPDGRLPPLTSEGEARRKAQPNYYNLRPASWLDLSTYDRCITRGVTGSFFPSIYGNGSQILQAPGVVALRTEMIHETRIIPLDGRPHASVGLRSYMGDPRGHWEGNTLVVETTNFIGGKVDVGGVPYSEDLKLVERFTRVAPDVVDYQVTVDDPKTFTRPWTVEFPIKHEPGYRIFEYACHEGNRAMHNRLSAARALDREEAEKAASSGSQH
ncbi:MAG TPA: hypothetical protein VMB25_03080 [Bryobacteraceae bacterium]|nr:hypothetical protein [Bryobacteraceae bacterium]